MAFDEGQVFWRGGGKFPSGEFLLGGVAHGAVYQAGNVAEGREQGGGVEADTAAVVLAGVGEPEVDLFIAGGKGKDADLRR